MPRQWFNSNSKPVAMSCISNKYKFFRADLGVAHYFFHLLSFEEKKKQNVCTKVRRALPCVLHSICAIICFKNSIWWFMIGCRNCEQLNYCESARMRWQAHSSAEAFKYHPSHRSLPFFLSNFQSCAFNYFSRFNSLLLVQMCAKYKFGNCVLPGGC